MYLIFIHSFYFVISFPIFLPQSSLQSYFDISHFTICQRKFERTSFQFLFSNNVSNIVGIRILLLKVINRTFTENFCRESKGSLVTISLRVTFLNFRRLWISSPAFVFVMEGTLYLHLHLVSLGEN